MAHNLFTAHPASVDETYTEHAGFALRFAFWLAVAAGAALIHAILPFACQKTASRIIARLHSRTAHRSGHSSGNTGAAPQKQV